jgi:hypothetical protein
MRKNFKPMPRGNKESRFSVAPPGHSMTQPMGKWKWEQPPEYTAAPEAVDAIISNLEKPQIQEMHVKLLAAGVSIEELVNTTVKLGFMEGKFTVDVAEVIKAPLAFYLMGLASDAGIDAKVFNTRTGLPRTNYGMKDSQILNIMRDRNPEFEEFLMRTKPELDAQQRQRTLEMEQGSFLGVNEDSIEGEAQEMES